MWNPYLPLSKNTKRVSTIISLVSVVLVWSFLSGFNLVGSDKLPAPWKVASAFSQLAWEESEQKISEERSLKDVSLEIEKPENLEGSQCTKVCLPLFEDKSLTTIEECEVDWTDEKNTSTENIKYHKSNIELCNVCTLPEGSGGGAP